MDSGGDFRCSLVISSSSSVWGLPVEAVYSFVVSGGDLRFFACNLLVSPDPYVCVVLCCNLGSARCICFDVSGIINLTLGLFRLLSKKDISGV